MYLVGLNFPLNTSQTKQISFYDWSIACVKYLFRLPATLVPRRRECDVFMCFILIESAARTKYFFRLSENCCLGSNSLLCNQIALLGLNLLYFYLHVEEFYSQSSLGHWLLNSFTDTLLIRLLRKLNRFYQSLS